MCVCVQIFCYSNIKPVLQRPYLFGVIIEVEILRENHTHRHSVKQSHVVVS